MMTTEIRFCLLAAWDLSSHSTFSYWWWHTSSQKKYGPSKASCGIFKERYAVQNNNKQQQNFVTFKSNSYRFMSKKNDHKSSLRMFNLLYSGITPYPSDRRKRTLNRWNKYYCHSPALPLRGELLRWTRVRCLRGTSLRTRRPYWC